jgi:hypothetical protein
VWRGLSEKIIVLSGLVPPAMAISPKNVSGWKSTLEAAKKHTSIQGEVVYAANLLHDRFFEIFLTALSLERRSDEMGFFGARIFAYDHALAIWHVLQSDSLQQELALAAISTVPTALTIGPAVVRLRWAKDQTRKLAAYRNLVAHSPVMFKYQQKGKRGAFAPNFGGQSTRSAHRARLELIGGLQFWRTLRNDLLKLSSYVERVTDQIHHLCAEREKAQLIGPPRAWPDRPRLRSLSRLQEIEIKLSRAARKRTRRKRRRAT